MSGVLVVNEVTRVEMAEFKIVHNPDTLVTSALGSCIGVALYDPELKIGGLAHIMLPDSSMARERSNPAKFADTAIEAMVEGLIKRGAECSRMEAKLAGGACMFSFAGKSPLMDIGEKNVAAARLILRGKGIRIVAEDTGKNYGRCAEFCCSTGKLKVKSLTRGDKEL